MTCLQKILIFDAEENGHEYFRRRGERGGLHKRAVLRVYYIYRHHTHGEGGKGTRRLRPVGGTTQNGHVPSLTDRYYYVNTSAPRSWSDAPWIPMTRAKKLSHLRVRRAPRKTLSRALPWVQVHILVGSFFLGRKKFKLTVRKGPLENGVRSSHTGKCAGPPTRPTLHSPVCAEC